MLMLLNEKNEDQLTSATEPTALNAFFEDIEGRLPVLRDDAHSTPEEIWHALNQNDLAVFWRRAAIAAHLDRAHGQRTDLGHGMTPLQAFARAVGVRPEHLSRLARTYRMFDRPDDPEIATLIADPFFSGKHFVIAACAAVQPKLALREAKEMGWSANHLARMVTQWASRQLLDADHQPLHAADDDDDLDDIATWRNLPDRTTTKSTRPRGTHRVTWLLTAGEHRLLTWQLCALSEILGTRADIETLLAILRRAHAEWRDDMLRDENQNVASVR